MSKMITLTEESIAEITRDFEKALRTAIPDGKINFQKTLGTLQRRAELNFKEIAWHKMQALIRACDKEVGWHGIAKRGDDPAKDEYIIEDILVYPQEVTGATVTPDQVQYQMWLMSHDDEVFNNIRMQGHSHVNMGTTPSTVDNTFYDEILRQLDNTMFYIFMIWNKRGEKTIKIYDMEKNVLFETADITVSVIEDDTGIEHFISESKKMISERTYTPAKATTAAAYDGYGKQNEYRGFSGYSGYNGYGNQQKNNYGTYKSNEPASSPSVPPIQTTSNTPGMSVPAPVVASAAAAESVKKKKGKKHRVKKSSAGVSLVRSSGSVSENLFDDLDNPYGPYGYRDEYYGYED